MLDILILNSVASDESYTFWGFEDLEDFEEYFGTSYWSSDNFEDSFELYIEPDLEENFCFSWSSDNSVGSCESHKECDELKECFDVIFWLFDNLMDFCEFCKEHDDLKECFDSEFWLSDNLIGSCELWIERDDLKECFDAPFWLSDNFVGSCKSLGGHSLGVSFNASDWSFDNLFSVDFDFDFPLSFSLSLSFSFPYYIYFMKKNIYINYSSLYNYYFHFENLLL